jgi:hypothetical protein
MIAISLLILVSSCRSSAPPSDRLELYRHPGVQWLSWTPAERENFILGYIAGHSAGVEQACLEADRLFEQDKPHSFGHDDVPSTFPSSRCRASVVEYSRVKVDLSKGSDFSPYTAAITEFYAKHPEYRDAPLTLLMESLASANTITANDIYRKWTTHESAQPTAARRPD